MTYDNVCYVRYLMGGANEWFPYLVLTLYSTVHSALSGPLSHSNTNQNTSNEGSWRPLRTDWMLVGSGVRYFKASFTHFGLIKNHSCHWQEYKHMYSSFVEGHCNIQLICYRFWRFLGTQVAIERFFNFLERIQGNCLSKILAKNHINYNFISYGC